MQLPIRPTLSASFLSASVLAAALLAGCQSDPASPNGDPASAVPGAGARQQAYDREYLALKSEGLDQKTLEARHRALLEKYGAPVPAENAVPSEAGPAAALEKTAASQSFKVKDVTGKSISFTYRNSLVVPNGSKLHIQVTPYPVSTDPNFVYTADPFLVAFYKTSGGNIQYVMVQDDSLHSVIPHADWTNTTGADRTVYFSVFAALPTAKGQAGLTAQVDGVVKVNVVNIPVGGEIQYANTITPAIPAGCAAEPGRSSLAAFLPQGTSLPFGLLALNNKTSTGFASPVINQNAVTATTYWIPAGTPTSKPYNGAPDQSQNFDLVAMFTSSTDRAPVNVAYHLVQSDLYVCN